MLHLFNRTYLEFDDKIEINFDRIVISERFGVPMYSELDKVAYGRLIAFGKTLDEVVPDIAEFISDVHAYGESTGDRKVIIYCDKENYVKFLCLWFKAICPNLDEASFQTLVDSTVYKERITSNTQLAQVTSLDMETLWSGLGDVTAIWSETNVTPAQVQTLTALNMNFSYEFLLAEYFSGSDNNVEELRFTLHKFLRRWFQECFTDNRQMVMLNLLNYKFQEALGFTEDQVDITKANLLIDIPPLYYYGDESIWKMTTDVSSGVYGIADLAGLPQDKIDGLRNTILEVYSKFEGMLTDVSAFSSFNWLEYACADSITKEEMDIVLNFVVNNPFDTCLVPRFDFRNVNFPLILSFIRMKKENKLAELSKFRLI